MTRRRRGPAVAALVVALLLVGACSTADERSGATGERSGPGATTDDGTDDLAAAGQRPPVHILVLDEVALVDLLHDGALNATRFERFAELAATSTWYTNWTVHSGRTIHSVPAMLSGVLPRNVLATPQEYPTNVFDLLGDAGWSVHGGEHNSWLCEPERCLDRLPYPEVEPRPAHEVFDAFEAELRDGSWPTDTLHVLHLLLPHTPWEWLPDGTRYGIGDPPNLGSRWAPDPWFSEVVGRVEYLWQLGHTDAVLGRWMDAIEARGEWDEALVVVTADHGIELRAGRNTRDILDDNHGELVWVPTFVKFPGQRSPRVVDRPHTATQLLAIVAEATGVALPDGAGEHERVVVADAWPYEDGAPLTFVPVVETARPAVTGAIGEGPGWGGLASRAIRDGLPPAIGALVGEQWQGSAAPSGSRPPPAGTASIDALDDLVGSSPGACGWDVAVSGHLDVAPTTPGRHVALVADGTIVGASPVVQPWPRAAGHIAARPSFFHILIDPDDLPTVGAIELLAVAGDGEVVGIHEVRATPGRAPRCQAGR